ncbi:MAG: O-antigen ligase family protein [Opitutae bacterium]
MISLGLLFGMISASGRSNAGIIIVLILISVLAAVNSIISTSMADTSIKWALWMITLFSMFSMAQRAGSSVDEALCKNTAPAFFIIWLVLAIKGNALADTVKESTTTLHLSAFYANLVICAGIFYPKKFLRILFVLVGAIGALTSGSRAAFLFLPLVFIPGVVYYFKVKLSSIAIVAMVFGLLFTILNNDQLTALTFGRKGEEITNIDSMELAERSAGGRAELREMGVNYIKDKPWGYGYGQSIDVVMDGKSLGNNLHNGYLNVATQMGLHIFLIYMSVITWTYYKLMTYERISRRSRFFTLSILTCVFLRAISESFSLFDLGHPAAFFCIFLISLFVIRYQNPQRQFT